MRMPQVEPTPDCPNPSKRKVTYRELYELVSNLVSALLLVPIQPGDRVASYSSNCLVRTSPSLRHNLTEFDRL